MTTTNPPRPTPAGEALTQIECSITDIEHLMTVLEERLGEVLCINALTLAQGSSLDINSLTIPGSTPLPPTSPLVSKLRGYASALALNTARLRSLLDRLEI